MSKFHAIKVTEDGITFDSRAEYRRYCELKLLRSAGEIAKLEVHRPFPLTVNGTNIGQYIADFVYWTGAGMIVEDVKGIRTPVYRLKKKLVKALMDIDITEIDA